MHLVTLSCMHGKDVFEQKGVEPFQRFIFPSSLCLSHVSSWSGFSPILPHLLCSQTSPVGPWLWPAISSDPRHPWPEICTGGA